MIQLCGRILRIQKEDGTTDFFQSSELQRKLEQSCRAAGLQETWIAEDITLSIEHSLREIAGEKLFTAAEIDSIVLKVLREAGMGAVATHYQLQQNIPEKSLELTEENIGSIIVKFMQIPDSAVEALTAKTLNAGARLSITSASPTLILELARHYIEEVEKTVAAAGEHCSAPYNGTSPWFVSESEIRDSLSGETEILVGRGIIKFYGISRLFPSLKIEINLAKFAEFRGFTPPLAEFAFIPSVSILARSVDEVIKTAMNQIKSEGRPKDYPEIPINIKFPDARKFTEKWLCGNLDDNRTCFEEIISELTALIESKIATYSA